MVREAKNLPKEALVRLIGQDRQIINHHGTPRFRGFQFHYGFKKTDKYPLD